MLVFVILGSIELLAQARDFFPPAGANGAEDIWVPPRGAAATRHQETGEACEMSNFLAARHVQGAVSSKDVCQLAASSSALVTQTPTQLSRFAGIFVLVNFMFLRCSFCLQSYMLLKGWAGG